MSVASDWIYWRLVLTRVATRIRQNRVREINNEIAVLLRCYRLYYTPLSSLFIVAFLFFTKRDGRIENINRSFLANRQRD